MNNYFVLTVLTFIFLSSCAWHPIQEKLSQKEITRFQDEIIFRASKAGLKNIKIVPVKFISLKEKFKDGKKWGGVCYQGIIYIDQKWWINSFTTQKEQLFLHEFGHCSLGLSHKKGIMGIKEIPSSFYLKNRETLINQMINQAKIKK